MAAARELAHTLDLHHRTATAAAIAAALVSAAATLAIDACVPPHAHPPACAAEEPRTRAPLLRRTLQLASLRGESPHAATVAAQDGTRRIGRCGRRQRQHRHLPAAHEARGAAREGDAAPCREREAQDAASLAARRRAQRREREHERHHPLPRCAPLLRATAEGDCHELAAPARRAQPRPNWSGQQLQHTDRAGHAQRAQRAPAAHAPE